MLAFNKATGEIDYYPIIAAWSHEDPIIQYLTIDGERIETTPNHPFKTGSGEWLPAGELQIGDTIRTSQWETVIVEAITFVYDPQPMYNLTITEAHTYFVGDGEWLVHNICEKLRDDIAEIAKKFPRGECVKCAEAITNYLKGIGISGKRMRYSFPKGYRGTRIFNTEFDEMVAVHGFHEYVEVDGYIFDNFYPRGKPKSDWERVTLFSPAGEEILDTVDDW